MQGGTVETKVSRFLFRYRITPQSTTGQSPAELLMGRKLKCNLDLLKPDISRTVEKRQENQKKYHDLRVKARRFEIGNKVFVLNFASGPKWIPGEVIRITGPVSYVIQLERNGVKVRRHVDQMRIRYSDTTDTAETVDDNDLDISLSGILPHTSQSVPVVMSNTDKSTSVPTGNTETAQNIMPQLESEKPKPPVITVKRNPPRIRKTPSNLNDYVCGRP